jgi:hypothetical protein
MKNTWIKVVPGLSLLLIAPLWLPASLRVASGDGKG